MTIKVTVPNTSSDSLTFGSANTPTAAQVVGIDSGSSNGQLAFNTTASGTSTERMRIDASGNVGVGTTTPTDKFEVKFATNGYMVANNSTDTNTGIKFTNTGRSYGIFTDGGSGSSDALRFYDFTAGAERARIDSSGNLLVGTTSADARFVSNNSSASMPAGYLYSTNASFTNDNLRLKTDRAAGGNAFLQLAVFSSSTLVAFIRDNGNLENVNNSYGAISDVKLKENIIDATPKLEKLNQVRIVNYNLIGDTTKQIGVVAQELEEVFPSMIEESPDRDAEGNDLGTTTKSVKYSVFVPMLIKAIQELKAIVDTQAAKIAALEAK